MQRSSRERQLLILLYHGVRPQDNVTAADVAAKHVPESAFRKQLQLIHRRYDIVTLTEAVRRISGTEPLRRDLACVTFDDGYENNATVAAPLLKALGIPATFFVTTDIVDNRRILWMDRLEAAVRRLPLGRLEVPMEHERIELDLSRARARVSSDARLRARLKTVDSRERDAVIDRLEELSGGRAPADELHRGMSWEQVRRLAAAGFEIGAHTVSHPILTRCGRTEAWREIWEGKRLIERESASECRHFALPNGQPGDWNEEVLGLVRQAGFSSCVTTVEGLVQRGNDPFTLKRVTIDAEDARVFWAAARGWRPALRRIRDVVGRWSTTAGAGEAGRAGRVAANGWPEQAHGR